MRLPSYHRRVTAEAAATPRQILFEAGGAWRALLQRWRGADGVSPICRAALVLFLAPSLAGCWVYPPPDAVRVPGGIEQVELRYGLAPLKPQSKVPLIKQALEEIEKTDFLRYFRGTTYRLTEGDRLPPGWLLQTPDVWGKAAAEVPFLPVDCENCDPDFRLPACVADPDCDRGKCVPLEASVGRPGSLARKFCVGHSDAVVDVFYGIVASAERAVDITMLQPAADFRFLAALRNAVTRLAYAGRAVTIRVIVGDYPLEGFDPAALLRELMRDAGEAPNSRLRIYAGAMRSCDGEPRCGGALSWNHAKIVAADGRRAIVGGHNLWTPDYLAGAPVHDVSMQVEGPAAEDAHYFADALWDFLCDQERDPRVNASYSYLAGVPSIGTDCLPRIRLPPTRRAAAGSVPILAVGRLAAGIAPVFADQSLVARDLMLGAATRTIRMLQQDVAFASVVVGPLVLSWPESVLDKIAALLTDKHGDVFLVLSNYGAAGPVGRYSNDVSIATVADKIRDVVQRWSGLAEPELSSLLCRRLHLAPLRFGPDPTWPDDVPIAVHAKFWMVDERAFYIGSENLYPAELQEFGYIVEDSAAAAQVRRDYWDHAWKWSQAAAVSGEGVADCIFESRVAKR
jgi:phosphatidylserine/phosphatidylglycerophosphate/cardiolipin synthase-like enzyme